MVIIDNTLTRGGGGGGNYFKSWKWRLNGNIPIREPNPEKDSLLGQTIPIQ